VVAAGVSGDGKKVYAVTQKGTVHVLDAATGEEKSKFEVSKARPVHMVLIPKGQTATGTDRLWVLSDDWHLHTLDPDKLTRSPELDLTKGNKLAAPSASTRLIVTPNETHVMVFDPNWVQGYSWARGSTKAVVPPALQKDPFNKTTKVVAFSSDGSVGAALASGKLLVFRARGARGEIRTLNPIFSPDLVAVAADAGVAAVGESGRLEAWKYDTGAPVMNVRRPHGFFEYFGAATGTFLVTAGGDRTLRVWDLRTGKERTSWGLDQAPAGVAVSTDGKTAVVWFNGGAKVGLWALPDVKDKK
jgi:WD40 repeat protein